MASILARIAIEDWPEDQLRCRKLRSPLAYPVATPVGASPAQRRIRTVKRDGYGGDKVPRPEFP